MSTRRRSDLRSLLTRSWVQAARARVHEIDQETLDEQLRIVSIPAPPLQETARGEYLLRRFEELGLAEVHRDEAGNVLGALGAAPDPAAETVVIAAHMDTVFPLDADLRPRQVGNRFYAPGITDNSRGLAALLALARVLAELDIRTERRILFVGTVGEEGIGDLRGVKHLFRNGSALADAAAFIALDGSGIRRVVHRAVGARRFRIRVRGPGGHSWADWGAPNAIHALGAAVPCLRALPALLRPRSTLTVARIGGGSSINAVPAEAWIELDLRSEDTAALAELETRALACVQIAVDEENRGRKVGTGALEVEVEVIGDRPPGSVPGTDRLVRAAVAATRAVGARPELAASSTDANVPLSLGISAVTLGAGGESGGIHTTSEWFANREAARGVERALLTLLAAAEEPRLSD